MEDYNYMFKIVLVGDSGVGKTCMVKRFTEGAFPPGNVNTIGVDFHIKTVSVGDDRVKMQVWDTAGQERFRSITQSFYRAAHAVVVVYDVTREESFSAIPFWLAEVDRYGAAQLPVILVGNKNDLKTDREVSFTTGSEFANHKNLAFIETSAKEGDKIEDLFIDLVRELVQKHSNEKVTPPKLDVVIPNDTKTVEKVPCCTIL